MAAVPKTDLPDMSVPESDLPGSRSAAPKEKSDFGGALKAGGKELLEQGAKIGAAEAGAEGGAALGSFAGPVGTVAGGLTGGALGYLAPGFLERTFPRAAGVVGFSPEERAKEKAAHPIATQLGALPGDIYGAVQLGKGAASLVKNAPVIAKAVGAGAKHVLGVPARATEEIAQAFEKRGYKLEPAQLKADVPSKSPGFAGSRVSNQKLANSEASATTGAAAGPEGITDKYLGKRFENLGKQYDALVDKYPGWSIDRATYDKLGQLVANEEAVAAGRVRPVEKIAADIRDQFQKAGAKTGTQISSFKMDAKDLKRYLSELKKVARTSSDGTDKFAASEAINAITGSLERRQPEVAGALRTLNQQYRSTVALDDLAKGGGIRGGNISLARLGDRIKYLGGNPLYDLGLGGRELNLVARWEGAGPAKSITPESLLSPGKLARTLGTGLGLRTQRARAVQRGFSGD
jgi:hypothetical protein